MSDTRRVQIGEGRHPTKGHCVHVDYAIERLEGSEWVRTSDREIDLFDYETGAFVRIVKHRDALGLKECRQ